MHFKRAFTQEVSSHYLLDLPKEYDEKTDWPLLVFLHGYGQSGDDLQIVRENGPPKRGSAEGGWGGERRRR